LCIANINLAIQQLNEVVQKNVRSTDGINHAATRIEMLAVKLNESISVFNLNNSNGKLVMN